MPHMHAKRRNTANTYSTVFDLTDWDLNPQTTTLGASMLTIAIPNNIDLKLLLSYSSIQVWEKMSSALYLACFIQANN